MADAFEDGVPISGAGAAVGLLRDSFTRLLEHVENLTEGLTGDVAGYRPRGPDGAPANSIAWLLWHSARVHDAQVGDIAGTEQVWFRDGWVDRFGLDLPRDSTGYGHTAEDVGKVRAPAELLAGYYAGVHAATLQYLATLQYQATPQYQATLQSPAVGAAAELARVVDPRWTPPVTAGVRLVSVVDDCAQHLGAAAYLRGIAP